MRYGPFWFWLEAGSTAGACRFFPGLIPSGRELGVNGFRHEAEIGPKRTFAEAWVSEALWG